MENENGAVPTVTERIKLFEAELKALQEKYQLQLHADVQFPIYKVLPDEVELAMIIIKKHGAVCSSSYIDKGGK